MNLDFSCEVIRDRKTGDSLQYAFIEFADRKSCEEAYFKMDNVLIDDRRIHVDFSQSVSKMRWRGKGKGIMYNEDKHGDVKKSKQQVFEDRGGRDRRRNSNDYRDSKYEVKHNEKGGREDRPKTWKHEKLRDDKYRRENEERREKRREEIDRNNERRRDRGKDARNRAEPKSRRESRSRSRERRGKGRGDEKRRDYQESRAEKYDRARQTDKRPRERSEERHRRKKDHRHDKYK